MSQETAWTIEEMGRAMRADRLAEAERYRQYAAVAKPSPSPRALLAQALRSLATLLDGEVAVPATASQRLVRVN